MAVVMRMAAHWACEVCKQEWFMHSEKGPRQCPKCGSRKWNDGEVAQADLLAHAVTLRHLNPYRRPLSVRQRAAILRRKANNRPFETVIY
jgi:hypothetical protein